MYALIRSSVSFSAACHKVVSCPQMLSPNCLFNSLYSIYNFLDEFPFKYFTNLHADKWNGANTSKCIWSLPTCPANISTSLLWQIIRTSFLVLIAICPVFTSFLYFVIHTNDILCRMCNRTIFCNFPYCSPQALVFLFSFFLNLKLWG